VRRGGTADASPAGGTLAVAFVVTGAVAGLAPFGGGAAGGSSRSAGGTMRLLAAALAVLVSCETVAVAGVAARFAVFITNRGALVTAEPAPAQRARRP
jgi:delta 1-pyrroline-5-carboxylate dehydrogenase